MPERVERVVDPPLEARQRANHQYTRAQARPFGAVRRLAYQRHNRVRRVRHDGADDSGEVARRELPRLAGRLFGRGEDVFVEQADDVLEEEEKPSYGLSVRELCECRAR